MAISLKKILAKLIPKQWSPGTASPPAAAPAPKDAPPALEGQNNKAASQQQKLQKVRPTATPSTLTIALQNKTTSSNVYAYITGLAINNNYAPVFIQADGRTVYFPKSPSQTGSPLEVDVAIPLGAPGNTVNAIIPKLAGGRIWFSVDGRLTFLLNPGPARVEPSVTNFSDPSINVNWSFCEFTYNDQQLFANITYVDFIGAVPIGLSVTNSSGQVNSVSGMVANGFDTVVSELRAQAARDGRPWDKLIYSSNGRPLRALSPNNLLVGNANAWGDYWNAYIAQVWSKFSSQDITINTQAAAGNLTGRVVNNQLSLGSAGTFSAPSAKDIFSNSTGPFQTGDNAARNAVIPRLAAAFNRSTLLDTNQFPNGSQPPNYYKNATTNHYARIVHQVQKDGRGYAFPYDDVVPDGGSDVAGTVSEGSPALFTVIVGGS